MLHLTRLFLPTLKRHNNSMCWIWVV
jgi:hypothetical protein